MKLRICMLLARFYPVAGGTELQAQRLAKSLINSGNDVFILTTRLEKLKKYELLDSFPSLPVFRTFSFGKGIVSSIFFCLSSFLFLVKNRNKYDIIHVHLASSHAFSAILIKIFFNKKILLKFGGARTTGDIGTSLAKPFGKIKLNIFKKHFNSYIVPGKEVFDEVIAAGFPENKITLIPNGVETDFFKPVTSNEKVNLRKELELPVEKKICTYVGRLENGKGLDILLNLWKRIPEDIILLIIGIGSLSNELEKSYKYKNVHFLGFKNNINNYLQASDIFILPSFGEGLSNSILEAMSCGLLVIANRITANEEIILDRENGIIVDFGTIIDFSILVKQIFLNKELINKLTHAARKTIELKFSMDKITNQYIHLYKTILFSKLLETS